MGRARDNDAHRGRGRAALRVIFFAAAAISVVIGIVQSSAAWLVVALVTGWIGGALRYQSPLSRPRPRRGGKNPPAHRDV